jgi:RNA polymerase sigma-70 factor (ECF subfamily)
MEEQELLSGCLGGDVEDFRRIVDLYSAQLMAVAMNVLGNREDAEDACQEALVQVFRHLGAYDPEKSFKTWLFTILYRRCLDMVKKKGRFVKFIRRARVEFPVSETPEPSNPGRSHSLPNSILGRLNPKERTVVCLWANEGYSAKEISQVLECSPSTARVYLFNARKKIKASLEKRNVALQNH